MAPARKIRNKNVLGKRVDALASEFAQIKSLLINLQPRGAPLNEAPPQVTEKSTMELPLSEEDAMSMTTSQSQFCEGKEDFLSEIHSQSFHDDSQVTAQGLGEEVDMDQDVVRQALQVALARLNLDTAPTVAAPSSDFFRGAARPSVLSIPKII